MNTMTDNAREEIIKLHDGIMFSAKRSVSDAIKIGEIISEQKKLLPHGEFLPWIEKLPFSRQTSDNYQRLYNHSDKMLTIGNLQEAYKQIETIEKQEKQTKQEYQRGLIAEYRKTGIKPDGWDRSLDYIIQSDIKNHERQEKEKLERLERAEKRQQEQQKEYEATNLYGDILKNATDNFFKKTNEVTAWKEKIRLSDNGKDDSFMDAIIDYLDTLENDNRRIEACNNIVKICRNISVQLQKV